MGPIIKPVSGIHFSRHFFALVIVTVILLPSVAVAQSENAVVSGKVTDASGAVVTGVHIVLKPQGCSCKDCANPDKCDCCPDQEAVSDDSGNFRFTARPGEYSVKATMKGFGGFQQRMTVNAGEHKKLNIQISNKG
jgi:hypothetical protein